MTVRQQMVIYAAYRISPKMGQATEDVIRGQKPTKKEFNRLCNATTSRRGSQRVIAMLYLRISAHLAALPLRDRPTLV